MTARSIYKPARTAMQSGKAKMKEWVLDYEPKQPRTVEPLMGWTSLRRHEAGGVPPLPTPAEEAVADRERHGIPHQVSRRSCQCASAFPTPTISRSAPRGVER